MSTGAAATPATPTRPGRAAAAKATAAAGAALACAAAISGCSGSATRAGTAPSGSIPAGQQFTADQLRQGLLTDIAGYRRTGEPDSGEYGSLRAVQSTRELQGQVKLDRPQCADAARPTLSSAQVQSAPAAILTFAKDDGHTITETLLAVPGDTAARLVSLRVAAGCRLFRARIGTEWSINQVVEATRARELGEGSRTVGVMTTSGGGSQVKTWYVVVRSRGYVASITAYGPNATRAEAEQVARQAYDQAERVLP